MKSDGLEEMEENMKKIPIWGKHIPGNSSRSKFEDMEIKGNPNVILQMINLICTIKGNKFKDKKSVLDTFTYAACIKAGYEKETYEDVPYLAPFPVEGSEKAVIVIPGGAYCYKQSDLDGEGKQSEGDLVAQALNKEGISAYVLWYRTNPYRMPIPLLDVQRAVRFLRYHAEEYGINPKWIGLIGFSAGGYQTGGFLNLLRGKNRFPKNYVPDEIDAMSDEVCQAAMIYPCLEFGSSPTMLFAMFQPDQVKNPETREKIIREYDCIENLVSADVPQFLSYGTKDTLISPMQAQKYAAKLTDIGGSCQMVVVEGAGHGYGAKPQEMKKYEYWLKSYLDWSKAQFAQLEGKKIVDFSITEIVTTYKMKINPIYDDAWEIYQESEIPGCGSVRCFLIVGKEKALLIDCGYGVGNIFQVVRKITSKPIILACTHGHIDHAFGGWAFSERYMHSADRELFTSYQVSRKILDTYTMVKVKDNRPSQQEREAKAALVQEKNINVRFDNLETLQYLDLGGKKIDWIHTPGHTAGSVCFIDEKAGVIFSGDTLATMVWIALEEHTSVKMYRDSLQKIIRVCGRKNIKRCYISHTNVGKVHDPQKIARSLLRGANIILKGRKGKYLQMGLVQGQTTICSGKVILWNKEHLC